MKIVFLLALLALIFVFFYMNMNTSQMEKKDCCSKPEVMGVYMPPTDSYPVDSRPDVEYYF